VTDNMERIHKALLLARKIIGVHKSKTIEEGIVAFNSLSAPDAKEGQASELPTFLKMITAYLESQKCECSLGAFMGEDCWRCALLASARRLSARSAAPAPSPKEASMAAFRKWVEEGAKEDHPEGIRYVSFTCLLDHLNGDK
jgi:hypothetical protein